MEPPSNIHGLRLYIGAYKVLRRVLPGYAGHLHLLEQATAGHQSKDHIVWNDDLKVCFKAAQAALRNTKAITLPRPDDTPWIVTDGAIKSQGIGATLYVLRNNKLALAGFFNAKL